MSKVLTVSPQSGPNAHLPVMQVDDAGNQMLVGALYLSQLAAAPTSMAGATALYVDSSGNVNFVGPNSSNAGLNVAGALTVAGTQVAQATLALQPATSAATALSINVAGSDAFDRFRLIGSGAISIGPGTGARDVTVGRSAAGIYSVTQGSFSVTTLGSGLAVKEGTNGKQGTAKLTAGTVTVANTSVTANSRILVTSNVDGGTPGWLRVSAMSTGVSFTITSSSNTDTSTVAFQIFEPA